LPAPVVEEAGTDPAQALCPNTLGRAPSWVRPFVHLRPRCPILGAMSESTPTPAADPQHRGYLRRVLLIGLALAAIGAALYTVVTQQWVELGALSRQHLAPWFSKLDVRLSLWTPVALAVGAGWIWAVPRLLKVRIDGRFAIAAAGLAMVLWSGVALSDGAKMGERREGAVPANGLTMPFHRTAMEYIGDVPDVTITGPVEFLRSYHTPETQSRLSLHSRTHPPGPILLLWGVERLLGPGPGTAAVVVLLFGALSLMLLFGLGRSILGPLDARLLILLMACTPGIVLFYATSMEPVFAALMLGAAWPLHVSVRRLRLGPALLGGFLLGISTLFTYASVLIAVWVAALVGVRFLRAPADPRILAVVGGQLAGFAVPILAIMAVGFDPGAAVGAALAADAKMMGTGLEGPIRWAGIGLANGAAWAISLGVASLAVLPHPREWEWSPEWTAAVAVLLFGCFSSLFTLEVERIWLPLHGLVLIAVLKGTSMASRPPIQSWIALLVTQTILFEILAETFW